LKRGPFDAAAEPVKPHRFLDDRDCPIFQFRVFVYRLEVGALEAMSVVHEPRIWVAKERLGESEQAATAEV
jgi:hypothetical protein